MAIVKPFKANRPANHMAHLIASRSVDRYTSQELKDNLRANPYSFLHIINPDFADGEHTPPGSQERLLKIKKRYHEFIEKGLLVQDASPSFYIYQQAKELNTYTGIIGCASIDDYFNGVIKIHEQTIAEREEKLKDYLEICDFNAEPVLFCYPDNKAIDDLIQTTIQANPVYDFTSNENTRHRLWLVNESKNIDIIEKSFSSISSIYIADGHHRSASSALLGKARRLQHPNYSGEEAFNYYLGAFFTESQLEIYDFNRVVKDLNGLSVAAFLKEVEKYFEVEKKEGNNYQPSGLHNFGLYAGGAWYSLTAKKEICNDNDPTGVLDAVILTEYLLKPILKINDLRTDKRISFIPGIKGMKELKTMVDKGQMKAAFALYPVTMSQLKKIADANQIMPPKSTWIEPKLKSGLTIYDLQSS